MSNWNRSLNCCHERYNLAMAKNSRRKIVWFTPVRGSYLPRSWQGWLLYVPFTGYLIFTLVYGIAGTSSWPKAILFIVPNWIAIAAVMTWIAARTS